VIVDSQVHSRMFEMTATAPDLPVTIDLPSQTLTMPDGASYTFPIDQFSKTCLVEGVDQMGYLLKREPLI